MNFRHLPSALRLLGTTALAWGVALSAVYAAADLPLTVEQATQSTSTR